MKDATLRFRTATRIATPLSVLSEILLLLVIRTRRWFFRSKVGTALLWSSATVAGITILLPYTSLAGPLGFALLPAWLLALVSGIVVLYAVGSEASKRAIFRRAHL